MKVEQKYLQRFEELIHIGENVLQTKYQTGGGRFDSFSFDMVDSGKSKEWGMKCKSTLSKVLGKNNQYYIEFSKLFEGFDSITSYENTRKAIAVLKAARDDYKDGYTSKSNEKNITSPEKNDDSLTLHNKLDSEARRNTKIYLVVISVFFSPILIALFYFFELKNSLFLTIGILVFTYFLSALTLKEWTPTKLPERILEIETERLYKRFSIKE